MTHGKIEAAISNDVLNLRISGRIWQGEVASAFKYYIDNAISENVNVFSPACDGIMDSLEFSKLFLYLQYAKDSMKTIYMSFGLSLLYNAIGLTFALAGKLSPLFAAIIMPMSAITIVSFVTIMSKFYGRKINKN